MRISVDKSDPGYSAYAFGSIVTVDGVRVEGCCFTADEELGEAHCYVIPLTIIPGTDRLETEVKRGHVVIDIPGGASG